jgi:hypothetical protein
MDEFQKIIPSENIIKLRKLTEQICSVENDEFVIEQIKDIIDRGTELIMSSKTEKTKLKYYEKMFSEIKLIINKS